MGEFKTPHNVTMKVGDSLAVQGPSSSSIIHLLYTEGCAGHSPQVVFQSDKTGMKEREEGRGRRGEGERGRGERGERKRGEGRGIFLKLICRNSPQCLPLDDLPFQGISCQRVMSIKIHLCTCDRRLELGISVFATSRNRTEFERRRKFEKFEFSVERDCGDQLCHVLCIHFFSEILLFYFIFILFYFIL